MVGKSSVRPQLLSLQDCEWLIRSFAQVCKDVLYVEEPSGECGLGNITFYFLHSMFQLLGNTQKESIAKSGIVDLLNDFIRVAEFYF